MTTSSPPPDARKPPSAKPDLKSGEKTSTKAGAKRSPALRPRPTAGQEPRLFWGIFGLAVLAVLLLAACGWWLWPQSRPVAQAAAAPAALASLGSPSASTVSGAPAAFAVAAAGVFAEAYVDELLRSPAAPDWRVRRLRSNTAILVIEFPGLLAQGEAFNRVAALLEKNGGNRERVLDNLALSRLIEKGGDNAASFYLGHDYDAEGLARFFNAAQAQRVALNPSELRLRQLLVDARLLLRQAQGGDAIYRSAGISALVSFSATQLDDPKTGPDESMDGTRRASVLRHELSHGEFFTRPEYREHCWNFWRRLLSEPERELWRRYLRELGYDSGNELLMVNETQALLMHTSDTRDFDAASLGVTATELDGLRARFRLQWAGH